MTTVCFGLIATSKVRSSASGGLSLHGRHGTHAVSLIDPKLPSALVVSTPKKQPVMRHLIEWRPR